MTDLAELITNFKYPSKTVTVYLDQNALFEFGNATDDDQKIELRKKVVESGYNLFLQGLARSAVNAIVRKGIAAYDDESEKMEYINSELLVKSIVKITNHEGEEVSTTLDSLREFLKIIPQPQFNKLILELNSLEDESLKYEDELTDPTFS